MDIIVVPCGWEFEGEDVFDLGRGLSPMRELSRMLDV
jgi:hypothetical protein